MGQKQSQFNDRESQFHSEQKPVQILNLQILLDNLKPHMLKKPSSQHFPNYQLLIQSQTDSSFIYGLKFNLNLLSDFQNILPQHLNFPLQIFLLQQENQQEKSYLIFEGELLKGKRNKLGAQYNRNGQVFYQGHFKSNKYHGWGITPSYQGQWANGLKCGYGKLNTKLSQTDNLTITYEGYWKNNKFDGLGIKNIALYQSQAFINDTYEPSYVQFDEQYIGEWLQGVKFGSGKLVKYIKKGSNVDCQIYQGEFARNLYHGKGKLKINSDPEQQGTFQNGKLINPL